MHWTTLALSLTDSFRMDVTDLFPHSFRQPTDFCQSKCVFLKDLLRLVQSELLFTWLLDALHLLWRGWLAVALCRMLLFASISHRDMSSSFLILFAKVLHLQVPLADTRLPSYIYIYPVSSNPVSLPPSPFLWLCHDDPLQLSIVCSIVPALREGETGENSMSVTLPVTKKGEKDWGKQRKSSVEGERVIKMRERLYDQTAEDKWSWNINPSIREYWLIPQPISEPTHPLIALPPSPLSFCTLYPLPLLPRTQGKDWSNSPGRNKRQIAFQCTATHTQPRHSTENESMKSWYWKMTARVIGTVCVMHSCGSHCFVVCNYPVTSLLDQP